MSEQSMAEARTYGDFAATVARFTVELGEFADGVRGPLPEGLQAGIRGLMRKAGDELRIGHQCFYVES